MSACGPVAEMVKGIRREQLRSAFITRPSVTAHEVHKFLLVAALLGMYFQPTFDGIGDLVDTGHVAIRLWEVIEQRTVIHMPAAGIADFGDAVVIKNAPAAL